MPTITRPRPGIDLTPRQRQVLALIEAGRTNFEIAETLGVSLDGAKYHVREILSKLGVESREEAVAAWRAEQRGNRWRWLSLTGLGFAKAAAVFGVIAAVAAGAAVAIVLLVGGDDDNDPVSPAPSVTPSATNPASVTPSASASPTPSGTPETIAGIDVKPLTLGDPVPLPEDVALYIERGCASCDVPAEALERVYRAADGSIRREDVFVGSNPVAPDPGYIMSISMETANDIVITICDGPTYCGGVANTFEGSKSSVRHSTDGGITWTTEPQLDGGIWFSGNMRGGPQGAFGLISREVHPSVGIDISTLYFYPSLDPAPIARTARILDPANGPPLVLGDDGVSLYRVEGGTSSTPWFYFDDLPENSLIQDVQFVSNGLAVTFAVPGAGLYTGFAEMGTPGEPTALTEIFSWPTPSAPAFYRPNRGFVGPRAMIIGVNSGGIGYVPAVIDFEAAAIRPISDFSPELGNAWNRNLVKGVQVGPFARVANTDGDCLNVREQPSLSATSFGCYAEGVLLVEQGQRTDADGTSWALVMAGDRQGWASTEFLETRGSAPSVSNHPLGTRTGIDGIDQLIAALEQSATVSQDLIAWRKIECKAPPVQGIGGPPECPEGVADGTEVDAITGSACEGYYRVRPDDGSPIQLSIGPNDRLYAVAEAEPAGAFPPGADYHVVYVNGDIPAWGKVLFVADGKVIGDAGGCGTSPAELLERAADVVFAPPAP